MIDPKAGEAVQRALWKFLEHAANEDEPSDEGRRLLNDFEQAADKLAGSYESTD